MSITRLWWTKIYAAHFVSKSIGVRLIGLSASLSFLVLGAALIVGTHRGWYKDQELTLRRYPFPPYVLYFGETTAIIYGFVWGAVCMVFGLALAFGFVI